MQSSTAWGNSDRQPHRPLVPAQGGRRGCVTGGTCFALAWWLRHDDGHHAPRTLARKTSTAVRLARPSAAFPPLLPALHTEGKENEGKIDAGEAPLTTSPSRLGPAEKCPAKAATLSCHSSHCWHAQPSSSRPLPPKVSTPRACSTGKRFAAAATRICMAGEKCGGTAAVQRPWSGYTRPGRWRMRLGHTAPPPPVAAHRARQAHRPAPGRPSSMNPPRSRCSRLHTPSRPRPAQSPRTECHPRRRSPSRLLCQRCRQPPPLLVCRRAHRPTTTMTLRLPPAMRSSGQPTSRGHHHPPAPAGCPRLPWPGRPVSTPAVADGGYARLWHPDVPRRWPAGPTPQPHEEQSEGRHGGQSQRGRGW